MMISIHASAKEATANGDVKKEGIEYFNPRLREGGDEAITKAIPNMSISIHASAKEATIYG